MTWNLRIIYSGNKVEIYKVNDYNIKTGITRETKDNKKSGLKLRRKKEINSKNRRRSHLTTIRNNIIRLAECNNSKFKSFITLTYNKDVTEEENTKYLNLFFTKIKKKCKDLSYIWVLERTEKGRIHVHILSSLSFPKCNAKSNERKTEEHKLQEQELEKTWSYNKKNLGWVDIRSINKNECRKYSLYLATYLNKSMYITEIEKQKHLYGYSRRNLNKPIEEKYETNVGIEQIIKDFIADYDLKFTNSYDINYENNQSVATVTYLDFYKRRE